MVYKFSCAVTSVRQLDIFQKCSATALAAGPNSSSFSAMRDSRRMCDIDNAMIIELICLLYVSIMSQLLSFDCSFLSMTLYEYLFFVF